MSLVDALQAALALEHQAVYGYGLVIAHLRGRWRKEAMATLAQHQERRDRLADLVLGTQATPTPAAPAYRPVHPVSDEVTAFRLAARIEDDAAGCAWDVVAAAPPASAPRELGVAWLTDAATAGADWHLLTGRRAADLPGQPA